MQTNVAPPEADSKSRSYEFDISSATLPIASVFYATDLTAIEKLLLLALIQADPHDGSGISPENDDLAVICSFDVGSPDRGHRSVRRYLARLEALGYISMLKAARRPPTRAAGRSTFSARRWAGGQCDEPPTARPSGSSACPNRSCSIRASRRPSW